MRRRVGKVDLCIGEYIRQMRKGFNLTQTDVGEFLDISCQQVQKYEAGKDRISLVLAVKLMDLLDMDIDYIIRLIESNAKEQRR